MQNSPLVAYIQFLLQRIVDARRLLLSPNDANLAVRSAMRCGRVMGSGNFPGRRVGDAQREVADWKFEVPIEWRM